MPGALASLYVEIGADTSGLSRGLKDAEGQLQGTQGRLDRAGRNLQSVGKTMTAAVTLPLVAVGAAALKTAVDFDTSMSRIQGLVGLSASEVSSMREEVLRLSGETTRPPQELAEALFFITSAGLRGSAALDVLESSAKAAAAGMGTTADVARTVTAAVNAYGPDVLDAARATDILVATAREGNLSATELAGSLGQVLPIASQAGVGLEEVGASVAFLTRSGGSASERVTQLNALLTSLYAPTAEASRVLREAGVSTTELQRTLDEDGLVAALELVQGAAGGSSTEFRKLLGSEEAMRAGLGLLNGDADAVAETFERVKNSSGALDNAFSAFAESAGFEASQAAAKLQVALVDLGDALLPAAETVASGLAGIAQWVSDLPPGMQTLATTIGVLVAAAGPLLYIGGSLARVWALVGPTIASAATTAQTALYVFASSHPVLATLTGLVVAAGAAYALFAGGQEQAIEASAEMKQALEDEAAGHEDAVESLAATRIAEEGMADAAEDAGLSVRRLGENMLGLADDVPDLQARLDELRAAYLELQREQNLFGDTRNAGQLEAINAEISSTEELIGFIEQYRGELNAGNADMADSEAAHQALQATAEETAQAIGDVADAISELFGEHLDVEEATLRYQQAVLDLREAISSGTYTLDENTQAGIENRLELVSMTRQVQEMAAAVYQESQDLGQVNFMLAAHAQQLVNAGMAAGYSEAQAAQLAAELLGIPPDTRADIHTTADLARAMVADLDLTIDDLPEDTTSNIHANTGLAQYRVDSFARALRQIPRDVNIRLRAQLLGEADVQRAQAMRDRFGARGMMIPATPGGTRIVAGEAGHAEVLLPLDPAMRARRMALLARAGLIDEVRRSVGPAPFEAEGWDPGGSSAPPPDGSAGDWEATVPVPISLDGEKIGEGLIKIIRRRERRGRGRGG